MKSRARMGEMGRPGSWNQIGPARMSLRGLAGWLTDWLAPFFGFGLGAHGDGTQRDARRKSRFGLTAVV